MEQLHGPIKIESVFSIENEEWPLQGDQEDSVMSASNELGHAVEDPVTVLIKREPLSGEQVDEKYTLMLESKESHHEFEDPLAIVKTEPLSNEQFQGSDKIKEEVIDSMKYFAEGACNGGTEVEESKTSCVVCGTAGQGSVCEQCQLPIAEDPHIPQPKMKEEVHKCKLCKGIYKTAKSLNRHTIRAHSVEKKYECSICKKCFPLESSLKRHIIRAHSGKKKYECTVCRKCFPQESNLKTHLLGHLQEFHLESMLQENKILHEQGTRYVSKKTAFPCSVCDKEFTRKASLKRHLRLHSSNDFRTHHNIQTDDKCYKCTTCKKVFSSRHLYNNHMFSHTGL